MKTTRRWSKVLLLGMFGVVLAFGVVLSGCATLDEGDASIQWHMDIAHYIPPIVAKEGYSNVTSEPGKPIVLKDYFNITTGEQSAIKKFGNRNNIEIGTWYEFTAPEKEGEIYYVSKWHSFPSIWVIYNMPASLVALSAAQAVARTVTTSESVPVVQAVNLLKPVTPPDSDFEVTQNTDGKTLTISGYKGTAKNIIIPATLYGLPVTVIGGGPIIRHGQIDGAFYKKSLTGVVIPDSVTTIRDYAFYDNQLTNVTIGNSVTTIGRSAFMYNQLTSMVIPDSVTTIGEEAFNGDYSMFHDVRNELTNVTLGNHVITIGDNAFSGNKLTSLTIPDSVITIAAGAFRKNQLTSLILGKNVTAIEGSFANKDCGAFSNNQLTSVIIPDSVTTIGPYAFSNNKLTSLVFGRVLNKIFGRFRNALDLAENAFIGNQLNSITIPANDDRFWRISTGAGFDESFINFYESQGRTPGTYVKNGPIWSKK